MKMFAATALSSAALISTAIGENLLDNASFEQPPIPKRTLNSEGGDPSRTEAKTSWTTLLSPKPGNRKEGAILTGLTNEIARTGKQSWFVDFQNYTGPAAQVILSSDILQVKPDSPYRISFWGRLDRKRPISMDERRPHFLVSIEYFAADQETQIRDTEYRTQMIPGNVVPNLGIRLLFSSSKWAEYYADLKSPDEAAFMKIVVMVETPRSAGETDGAIYIDDAAIDGERGTAPLDIEEDESTPATVPAPGASAPQKPEGGAESKE